MANGAITVGGAVSVTNDQRHITYYGTLTVGPPTANYIPGGLPLDSVLKAALLPQTNQPPVRVLLTGRTGTGYIYQRIASTGNMMILQVPPSASLTTAAPLQELPAASPSLSEVAADIIDFEARYIRNA